MLTTQDMQAAVSCSPVPYRLGGVGFGLWLMGKLGRAWHRCMGGVWVHGSLMVIFETKIPKLFYHIYYLFSLKNYLPCQDSNPQPP